MKSLVKPVLMIKEYRLTITVNVLIPIILNPTNLYANNVNTLAKIVYPLINVKVII